MYNKTTLSRVGGRAQRAQRAQLIPPQRAAHQEHHARLRGVVVVMGSHSRTLALSYSRTVSLALRSSPGRAVAGGQAGPGGHVVRRLYRRTQSAADGRRGSDRGVVLRRRRGGADVLADRREEQQQASGQAEVYLLQGNWYVGFLYVHRGWGGGGGGGWGGGWEGGDAAAMNRNASAMLGND